MVKLKRLILLAEKKWKKDGRRMREFNELREVFEELYGWAKAKEAIERENITKPTTRPSPPTGKLHRVRSFVGEHVFGALITKPK